MGLAIKHALVEIAKSFACVVGFILMKSPFDNKFCISKEFGEKSLLYKVN